MDVLNRADGLTLAYRLKYIHAPSANKTMVTIQRVEPFIPVFFAMKDIVILSSSLTMGFYKAE